MSEQQEIELERLLRVALSEPAHRPEFYRRLMDASIYTLGHAPANNSAVPSDTDAQSAVELLTWGTQDGTRIIPFFTSQALLGAALEFEQPSLTLPTSALFKQAQGHPLVLNPYTPHSMNFSPDQVERLLLTHGCGPQPIRRGIRGVPLGQPGIFPPALIGSLTQLLAKYGNVRRATLILKGYLDLGHNVDIDHVVDRSDVKVVSSYLIGIEADGDCDTAALMQDAVAVAADTEPHKMPVEFFLVNVQSEDPFSHYFVHEAEPFYDRRWGAKLHEFSETRTLQ